MRQQPRKPGLTKPQILAIILACIAAVILVEIMQYYHISSAQLTQMIMAWLMSLRL